MLSLERKPIGGVDGVIVAIVHAWLALGASWAQSHPSTHGRLTVWTFQEARENSMKLYVGANGLRPDGYKTLDIDPRTGPDIVADLCNMVGIETGSCDEIVANAVLEHIEWPDAFKALGEMVRCLRVGGILKVSVPDMSLYARLILNGDNNFHLMSVIFGLRGRTNIYQAHRFGYTPAMLCQLADLLGCGNFNWFNMNGLQDASGGWMPRQEEANIAEAVNFSCVKLGEPPIPPARLFDALLASPMKDILKTASDLKAEIGKIDGERASAALYQRIHYNWLNDVQRMKHLEAEYDKMRVRAEKAEQELHRK